MIKKISFIILFCYLLVTTQTHLFAQITAHFGATTAVSGYSPLNVTFHDSTTGGHLWRWHWTYDITNPADTVNTTAPTSSFSHNYATSGTYTVKMVVYDSLGHVDSITRTNYVHAKCQAKFTGTPLSGYAPLGVHFTNQTTGGHIYRYHFQFDTTNKSDTQSIQSTTFNFTHTYSLSGIYSVKLIVYDSLGNVDSLTKQFYDTVRPQSKFTASPANGCVSSGHPFNITFTNAATGGHTWKYHYCFDTTKIADSASSPFIASPSFTYTTQGTYVVKQTVYDSLGNRDSSYKSVVVTGPPTVNFYTPDTFHLCAPYTVTFTNTSDTSAGCTQSYEWFIDTAHIFTTHQYQTVSYTFTRSGTYNIALTQNESACNCGNANTRVKNNYIIVDSLSTPCFSSVDTNGCGAPYAATFTNCSVGAASYLWNFGDGTSDTTANPIHTYNATNTTGYTDTLTSYTAGGCPTSLVKTHYVKVGHFNAGYETYFAATPTISSTILCMGVPLTLKDTTSGATNHHWRFTPLVSDTINTTSANFTHTWTTSGIFNVTDSVWNNSGCSGVATHTIFVAPNPLVDSITANYPYRCLAPDTVQFHSWITDTTTYAVEWHFGEPSLGDLDTAYTDSMHAYENAGQYSPSIKVTDAYGCVSRSVFSNFVNIAPPYYTPKVSVDSGCAPLIVGYSDSVSQGGTVLVPNADYYLDSVTYGDGSATDTGINITGNHTYTTYGRFMLYQYFHLDSSLGGCAYFDSIQVSAGGTPLLASPLAFLPAADSVCPQSSVPLNDPCSNCTSVSWITNGIVLHTPDTSIVYTSNSMKQIMYVPNYYGCTDTLRDSVYIWLPNVNFTATTPACGIADSFRFTNTSAPPAGNLYHYVWNFGDLSAPLHDTGSISGGLAPNVSHIYSTYGTYSVTLTDSSNYATDPHFCWNTTGQLVYYYPIVNTDSMITASKTLTCKGTSITFKGYETQYHQLYSFYTWRFGDGVSSGTSLTDSINHVYSVAGTYSDTLILKNRYNCLDTTIATNLVTIETPYKAVHVNGLVTSATVPVTNCAYFIATFHDSTTAFPGTTLTKRRWLFNGAPTVTGTGTPPTSLVAGTIPQTDTTIAYPAGLYHVIVTDTDNIGCFSADTILINSVKPHAYFSSNDTIACTHVAIHFHDTTTHVSKNWIFGDNSGVILSSSVDTSHIYFSNGTYSDTLVTISDGTGGMMSGCRDTMVRSNYVAIGNSSVTAGFNFSGISFASCPPLTVHTINTSSSTSTSYYEWKFGVDSTLSSTSTNPTFTYDYPGIYTVTLVDSNSLGCKSTFRNTVTINGPTGTLTMTPDTVCVGSTLLMHMASASLTPGVDTPFFWQTGIGTFRTDTSGYIASYGSAGVYHPYATITQVSSSCTVTVYAKDSVRVSPLPTIVVPNDSICKNSSVTVTATGAGAYVWSPSYGLSTTTRSNPVASPTVTTTYKVIGISNHGCVDSVNTTVVVNPTPTAIGGSLAICNGATGTLTNGVTGGIWSTAATAIATVDPVLGVVNGLSAGTVTISYTIGNCYSTAILTVNLQPDSISGISQLCNSYSTLLSDATGGGTWSSANSAIASVNSGATMTANAPGTTVISYTRGICYSVLPVTINANPTSISGTLSTCALNENPTTLTDASAGGKWYSANTLVAQIDSLTGTMSGQASGTAVISYTDSVTGCYTTAIATVNSLPGAITGTASVCAGSEGTVTLHNGTSGGNWSINNTSLASINASSGVVTGTIAGIATVSYTLSATGCYSTKTFTVDSLPANIAGLATVCEASENTITLTDGTSGGTWISTTTAVATIGSSTGTVTGLTAGSSIISYKIGATGCYTTTTLNVTARPDSILGVTGLCASGQGTITLTDASGTGTWSSSNTALFTVDATSGAASGVASGTGTVTFTLASTGCYRTASVHVNALPAAITGTPSVCEQAEGSATLHSSTGGGHWSMSDTTVALIGNTTGVLTGVAAGTAVASYTIVTTGCYATQAVTVNPTPDTIAGNANVCESSETTTTLTDATSGGTWFSSNTTLATINGASGVVTGLNAGNPTISYKLTATGCYSTIVLIVNPRPAAISGNSHVCSGSENSVTLADVTPNGTWTSGNTAEATVNAASGIVVGISVGSPVITYTLDTTGCYRTLTMSVNPTPDSITGTLSVCAGAQGSTDLNDVTSGGTWSVGTSGFASINTATGLVTGIAAGVEPVTYTIGATGCYSISQVTVNPLPSVITGALSVCAAAEGATTLHDSLSGGAWSTAGTFNCTINPTGVVTGLVAGNTTVTYTMPASGCYATTQVTVLALPSPITGSAQVCHSFTTSLSDATIGGTWSSENNTIASVNSGGIMTGNAVGTTVVSYTIGLCYSVLPVTINANPTSISGTLSTCALNENPTTLTDASAGGKWYSANTLVAQIDSLTGTMSGQASGTAVISYTDSVTGCYTTAIATVNSLPGAITGTASVCAGSEGTVTLHNGTSGGNWSINNTSLASINASSGVVTGTIAGIATVSYTLSATGCYSTKTFTVDSLPANIAGLATVCEASENTITLTDGTSGGTWISTTTAVATIGSSTGTVTGLTAGSSIISYKIGATGCYTTTTLNVTARPDSILGVTGLCASGQGTITLTDASGTGTWSSSNTALFTVDATSGAASGVASGTGTVTFTLASTGCYRTASVHVNALPAAITGTPSVCEQAEGSATLHSSTGGGHWSMSDTTVALIGNTTGVLTGVAAGTAVASYTIVTTGCYATQAVTVNPTPDTIAGNANVCESSETTTTLTDATSGGTWFSSNTTLATINGASGVVTGLNAGNPTISYKLTATGCYSTIVLIVNPRPAAISGNSHVCSGSENSVTLADVTPNGTWTSGNTAEATVNAASGIVVGISVGSPVITYTLDTTGCYRTLTMSVNPTPDSITGTLSVCAGAQGSTDLNDVTSGGTWSVGTSGFASINTATGLVTGIAAGVEPVTYTIGATGCYSISQVTVNPLPSVITGALSVCAAAEGATTLHDSLSGGAWSTAGTFNCTINPTGVVTGLVAGNTTVTYTMPASGCYATTQVTVLALPSPITGTLNVCADMENTSTISDLTPTGAWTIADTTKATLLTIAPGIGAVTGRAAGTTTVTYTNTSNSCYVTNSISVNAIPGPISGTSVFCNSSSQNYTASNVGGTWSIGNPTVLAIVGTGTTISANGLASGVATLTYSIGSCYTTKTVTVQVQPSAITGTLSVCNMHETTLASTPSGGTWTTPDSNIATIDAVGGTLTGLVPGTALISYSYDHCITTSIVTVNVQPSVITGSNVVCQGHSATLADSMASGVWTSSATAIATINAAGVVTSLSPGTTLITYSIGSCQSSIPFTTKIQPVAISGNPGTLCDYGSLTLHDLTLGGSWESANNSVATIDSISGLVTASNVGITVLTYSINGCFATTSLSVTSQPDALKPADTAICDLSSLQFTNDSAGGNWSLGGGIGSINASGLYTASGAGTLSVTYAIGSCRANTQLTINPQPEPLVIPGGTLCENVPVLLQENIPGGTWSVVDPSVATIAATGIDSATITGLNTGTTTISYTLGSCYAALPVTVAIQPSNITGGPDSVCLHATVTLADSQPGGNWTSANSSIASVSATGTVTGIQSGIGIADTATIFYSIGRCRTKIVITVNPLPTLVGHDTMACQFSPLTLDVSGAASYSWAPATGLSCNTCSTATAIIPVTTVYTITGTSTSGCNSVLTIRDSAITAAPLTLTGKDSVCSGAKDTIVATGPASVKWYPAGDVNCSTCTTVHATVDSTINLTAIGTDINGCHDTATIKLTALPYDYLTSDRHPGFVCSGASVVYMDTVAYPTTSITWTRNAVTGITPATGNGTGNVNETLFNSGLTIDSVTYLYKIVYQGCTTLQPVTLAIEPMPAKPGITVMPSNSLCQNTDYQNFGAGAKAPAGEHYQWSAINATIWAESAGNQNCVVNFDNAGPAFIILSVSADGAACFNNDTATINVRTSIAPDFKVVYDNSNFVCLLDSVSSYQWGYDDIATLTSHELPGEINQNYYNPYPDFTTKYYWVQTSNGGCQQKAYYNVPTGISNYQFAGQDKLTAYPNPASGTITVAVESSAVSGPINVGIFDLTGKLIKKTVMTNTCQFNISDIADGCYLIRANDDNHSYGFIKFIKISELR